MPKYPKRGRADQEMVPSDGLTPVNACMEEAAISGRKATPRDLRHGFGVSVLQSAFRSTY
jgi:hypothetical protein